MSGFPGYSEVGSLRSPIDAFRGLDPRACRFVASVNIIRFTRGLEVIATGEYWKAHEWAEIVAYLESHGGKITVDPH